MSIGRLTTIAALQKGKRELRDDWSGGVLKKRRSGRIEKWKNGVVKKKEGEMMGRHFGS